MPQSAVPLIAATLVLACGSPTPEMAVQPSETAATKPQQRDQPSAPVVQPNPELVGQVVRQIEASINIAANPQSFLGRARGNRRQAVLNSFAFQPPLNLSKRVHDTAPEVTKAAYDASVAAHEAAFRHNRLWANPQADVDELLAARSRRDETFHAALEAWKQFDYVPVDY